MQDGTHLTDEDSNVHYIEKESEEPGKSCLTTDTEKKIKDAATAVHDVALEVCDSLKTMQEALHELGKVVPLNIYMKIVREQQIPNVKVVINVAQGIPDQPPMMT